MENFVTIRLEITANDANELAGQIGMLAVAMSAAFAPRQAPSTEVPASENSQMTRKPRTKKGATIDHDPNEGGKTDVLPAAGAEDASVDTGLEAAPAEGGPGSAGETATDVETAVVDAVAEKTLTFDELKAYGIAYLNDTIPKADDRKAEYRAILDHFKVEKFGDLTPEQYAPFQVEVDRRRAAWAAKKAA